MSTSPRGEDERCPPHVNAAARGSSINSTGRACAAEAAPVFLHRQVAVGIERRRPRSATVTWSPTAPRASREHSRIVRCCARTRTRSSKACRSPQLSIGAPRGIRRGEGVVRAGDRGARACATGDGRRRAAVRRAGEPRRRAGGVPVRRGDGAARGHRGQRPDAALAAAVPSRAVRDDAARRVVGRRPPSRGSTRPAPGSNPTLVNNVETLANVPAHPRPRSRLVPRHRHPRDTWPLLCTVVGDVTHAGFGEIEPGTPLREVIDALGGGAARRASGQGSALGRLEPSAHRRRPRRAGELRGSRGRRQRARVGGLHRVRRHPQHARGRAHGVAVPLRRVVRTVPGVQVRHRRDHPRTSIAIAAGRGGRRHRGHRRSVCATSPTRTGASSARRSSA